MLRSIKRLKFMYYGDLAVITTIVALSLLYGYVNCAIPDAALAERLKMVILIMIGYIIGVARKINGKK